MNRNFEKDKTLLVDGPTSVTVCLGKVEVLMRVKLDKSMNEVNVEENVDFSSFKKFF